ncbi:diguanylate cyclase/phosphodiesterase (GGDEF & EAL domains) with PAS/PAC sensor(s) [hydrothermal vent metagenome]|uniref:Diguanylate cyclase/phosphodiesterase (GGDEF & EAL domains) with PAS/PAC sensor(S) n=1 Tax=hydrothermal vent metagenome TaxID=652676 RepID=A0A3B1B1A5_9ZZZZ
MPAGDRLRILLVEQNPVELKLLQELLQDPQQRNVDVCALSTLHDAIEKIKQQSFDVALIDAVSRDVQHLGLFHAIKAKAGDLPVIILIETLDQNLLRQAMDEGVQDYIFKQEVDSSNLLMTIRHVVLRARLKRLPGKPRSVAPVISKAWKKEGLDELTGLPGQVLFIECLEYEIKRARRYSQLMALMFIHVDGLEAISAQAGEEAVDAILLVYSERLKNILRASDTSGFYAENEFSCILNDLSDESDVHIIISKVETSLSAPVSFYSQHLQTDVKIGLALYPGDSDAIAGLTHCARTALSSARQKTDSNAKIFNARVRIQDLERFKVADAVRFALEKNELQLYLQPVLGLAQKNMLVAEAMLYWQHPDYAEISSRDILFLAELAGLVQPVGEWLLRQACLQHRRMQQQQTDVKIRVHLPSGIFRNSGCPALLRTILTETEMAAENLQLAVPVSAIMQSPENAHAILEQLDRMGVCLLLDDFGGNRSSMQILKDYPIKGLVIENSIISRISRHQDACGIVKTIISMCQALHLELVAKGVDSATQEKLLSTWHCPAVQGGYYAKAVVADDFFKLPLWTDVARDKTGEEQSKRIEQQQGTAQAIRDSLVALNNLPPMAGTTRQLLSIRNNPDAGMHELEAVIEQDPAIAAQIIRYANAPFFGNQGQIKTINEAVMTALGFDGALSMALGIAVLGNLQSSGKSCLDLPAFWRHAVYAAALSQAIARQVGIRDVMPGTAWLAGLLQNIGYLVLSQNFQTELGKIKAKRKRHPDLLVTDVEERVLGISHAEVGLHVLRAWHFPEEIVSAVFEHHNVAYVGKHAVYANIVLIANRMLAQHSIGDETLGLIPPGIMQMLSLNEAMLGKIMDEIMGSRDGLDIMGKHLAA